jgi:hypothetical protein
LAAGELAEQIIGQSEAGADGHVGGENVGQRGQQQGGRQLRRSAEPQRPTGQRRYPAEVGGDVGERVERAVEPAGEVLAGRGGVHAAGLADEQRLSDRGLQRAQLRGHCRLGQSQCAGGGGDGAGPVDRLERAQQVQGHGTAGHPPSFP